MINETIALLGLRAADKVTGYTGTITSVAFDLYGCVQAILTPAMKDGETEFKASHWLDVNRLHVTDQRVMDAPDFEAKGVTPESYAHGAADKPVIL